VSKYVKVGVTLLAGSGIAYWLYQRGKTRTTTATAMLPPRFACPPGQVPDGNGNGDCQDRRCPDGGSRRVVAGVHVCAGQSPREVQQSRDAEEAGYLESVDPSRKGILSPPIEIPDEPPQPMQTAQERRPQSSFPVPPPEPGTQRAQRPTSSRPGKRKADGTYPRTAYQAECSRWLEGGDIDRAEKGGCYPEICEAYLDLFEIQKRELGAIDTQLAQKTTSGIVRTKARTRQIQAQRDRKVAAMRRTTSTMRSFCGKAGIGA
jgi:hypothetical protein